MKLFGKGDGGVMNTVGLKRKEKTEEEKRERALVIKLDCAIMTYCCASYFFNYLDRAAFGNAYVAGLKEALNLRGNEYSVLLSAYTAGNVLGQIPHGLIIQKIRPSIWLPLTLIIWSGLTMCSAACRDYSQLFAVRFLQGFFEASLYSGTIYIIGSWYKPLEIAKRFAIFTAVGQVGSMFAGIMMTAIRQTMDGRSGLAGWQWVFLIDGLMGIPIGFLGFFVFPDTPETTRAFYLNKDEVKLAISRMPPKAKNANTIEIRSLFKRLYKYTPIYIFTLYSIICAALEAIAFQGLFLLWMKANESRFTKAALNTYPLGVQAVAIVSQLMAGYYIDATNKRMPVAFVGGLLQLISAILLLVPNLSDAGTFFALYNSGTSYFVNPLEYGWASVVTRRSGDDVMRAVTLYTMNAGGQILYTFYGIVLYPATDAPYWRKGCIAMIVVVFLFIGCTFWCQQLDRRTQTIKAEEDSESEMVEAEIVVVAKEPKI